MESGGGRGGGGVWGGRAENKIRHSILALLLSTSM